MRNTIRIMTLFTTLFVLTATTCDKDEIKTCEEYQELLQDLKNDIDALVDSSTCTEASECSSIAFGSKACGGPHSYLIYSTSIDTARLESLVKKYNDIEKEYNSNCDVISDCMFVTPPAELACENGKCVIVN